MTTRLNPYLSFRDSAREAMTFYQSVFGGELEVSTFESMQDEALLRGWWEGLSDGGVITMPLNKAPWGASFGMCTDKFGVEWMFNITDA